MSTLTERAKSPANPAWNAPLASSAQHGPEAAEIRRIADHVRSGGRITRTMR
jgi:hypothetical protein